MSSALLTPGAQARIYERGMLRGAVLVPHGRMELRNLAPGEYEARCEGPDGDLVSVTFLVSAFEEVTTVQIPEDADEGPVPAAETPQVIVPLVGGPAQPDPIYPGTPQADVPDDEVEQAGVLGAPADFTHGNENVAEPAAPGVSTDEPAAPADPADPEPYIANLEAATVAQLRHEAKRLGLVQRGNRGELLDRVRAAHERLGEGA